MSKINVTVNQIDGGVKVFPSRDALQTTGDYLVIQGAGHMNFIPLAQLESVDYFPEQEMEKREIPATSPEAAPEVTLDPTPVADPLAETPAAPEVTPDTATV